MKKLVTIALLTIVIVSCSKERTTCDNAVVCVKNIGNDTINYAWNSTYYDSKLLAGEKTCIDLGEVDIEEGDWFASNQFNNDHGDFGILSTGCNEEFTID
jgi:hypothetical protein